jgi:hypothetical protein
MNSHGGGGPNSTVSEAIVALLLAMCDLQPLTTYYKVAV